MKKMMVVLAAMMMIVFCGDVFAKEAKSKKAETKKEETRKPDPDFSKDSPKPDPEWAKENEKLVSMINEKKYEDAFKKAKDMLEYLEKKQLLETQEAATTYNNLGMLWLANGKFDKSQEYLSKSLQLRTRLFGPESLEVATVWLNLSHLYKFQAQYIFQLHKKDTEPAKPAAEPAKDQPVGSAPKESAQPARDQPAESAPKESAPPAEK